MQPGERFYVFTVRQADNSTVITASSPIPTPRAPLRHGVDAENLVYDTMKEAYFHATFEVQVGYSRLRFRSPGRQREAESSIA